MDNKFVPSNGGFPPLKYCNEPNKKDNIRSYTSNNTFIPLNLLLKENNEPLIILDNNNDDNLDVVNEF